MPFLPSWGRKGGYAVSSKDDGLPVEVPAQAAQQIKEILTLRASGDTVLPAGGRAYGGTWSLQRAIKQAYENVTWVYKAVETIAGQTSRLPLGRAHYQGPDQDHGPVDYDFPAAELWNGRANPVEMGQHLRKRLAALYLLSPRGAFVEAVPAAGSTTRIVEYRLLPSSRTRPVPDRDGNIDHYELVNVMGTERKKLDAERVRWFRNPHPEDPWRNMTPLEASGLTVELDYFARVSARSFAINDGRPGMLVAVEGELEDDEMERIERKFSPSGGPTGRGRTTVIAGKLTAADMSSTPREADYGATRIAGRDEILAGFGTALSVIGDSSGRTWDNAEQELYNFWTITMPTYLGDLQYPWFDDVGGGYIAAHDLSKVEVLQRAARQREDRLLALWGQGLITVDEFRDETGRDPYDRPSSRALWIPGGKYAVPRDDDDLAWLSALSAETEPKPEPPPEPPVDDQAAALDAGQPPAEEPPLDADGLPADPAGMAQLADAVNAAFTQKSLQLAAKAAQAAADDVPHPQLEEAVAGVVADMVAAACDRLTLANVRKGTPYWDPPGQKRLDVDSVVQADRWIAAAEAATRPLLEQAVAGAVKAVDAAAGMETKAAKPPPPADTRAAQAAVKAGLETVRAGVAAEAGRLRELLAAQTLTGAVALVAVVALAKRAADGLENAARHVGNRAGQVAAGDAAEQRATVLQKTAGLVVSRQWVTRKDGRVRPAHKAAEGQVRRPGAPFDVGGAKLRWPGDPQGPPEQTINCRCKTRYVRSRRTARTP